MTRETGSDARRTITDLSWPKGTLVKCGVSISSYLDTDFILSYPSVDLIIGKLNVMLPIF